MPINGDAFTTAHSSRSKAVPKGGKRNKKPGPGPGVDNEWGGGAWSGSESRASSNLPNSCEASCQTTIHDVLVGCGRAPVSPYKLPPEEGTKEGRLQLM